MQYKYNAAKGKNNHNYLKQAIRLLQYKHSFGININKKHYSTTFALLFAIVGVTYGDRTLDLFLKLI